jgi:spore maturation protein CgeB
VDRPLRSMSEHYICANIMAICGSWTVTSMRWISYYYRIYARFDAAAIADSLFGRFLLWSWGLFGNVLYKIGILEKKPWFNRSSMFSVRNILDEARRRHIDSFILPPEVSELKELRVGCVVDNFTMLAFSPECQLLSVTSEDWKAKLEDFKPHMLLVESAWLGKEDSWKWKVSVLSPELVEMVVWCKRNGIPTVFWNKEDPKHFETFIRAATFFDVIFTTDADCISEYRSYLGTDRVHLLPFAAQPNMHNPIETLERKDSFCFAGSYYTQQMDRNITFSRFVTAISSIGELEIFDRYLNTKDVRMSFPERYRSFIVGTLPPENMERAYKGYTYGVNMNTIKGSQTMFARRVFELLASNTVSVGNYSRGLRNFLGDLTVCTDDVDWFKRKIVALQLDGQERDKYRLLGLRAVMSGHTYRHRLERMVRCTFDRSLEQEGPKVMVVSDLWDGKDIARVLESYHAQTYVHRSLLLVVNDGMELPAQRGVRIVHRSEVDEVELDEGVTHLAYFSPNDFYGPNYLTDLAQGAAWSGAQAVGKACFFQGDKAEELHPEKEYRFVARLDWRCSLIETEIGGRTLSKILGLFQKGSVEAPVCLSLDRFNYCRDHVGTSYSALDLDVVDQGIEFSVMGTHADRGLDGGETFLGKSDVLYLCGTYPQANRAPAFNFLHARPSLYKDSGALVDVVRLNRTGDTNYYGLRDVDVAHVPFPTVDSILSSGDHHHLQVHMLNEDLWSCIRPHMDMMRTEIWIYGPEIVLPDLPERNDHYRRDRKQLERHAKLLVDMWQRVFSSSLDLVFASQSLARTAMEQVGLELDGSRYRVSYLPVDTSIYRPVFRGPKARSNVLCVRPYAGTMVDLQLLVDTILVLSSRTEFKEMRFTVAGDWTRYGDILAPLRRFSNVQILNGDPIFERRAEMFANNSILLAPYSADPHGAALAEAMASGMVPVVTDVGSVRELVDETSAMVTGRDASTMAEAVLSLVNDPQRSQRMSENAVKRAVGLRGTDALITEMLQLFETD